jgi:hypothetical protein
MSLYRLSQHGEDDLVFVRSLTIERFRGLEHLEWQPPGRVNCLIGPGDAGKSTILSAIEMVLDPRPSPTTSEYDYFRRRVEEDFRITAVLGDLDDQAVSAMRTPPLQGWLDGKLQPLPDEDGADRGGVPAVRRPPGARVQRWSGPHGAALLHQRRLPGPPAAAVHVAPERPAVR